MVFPAQKYVAARDCPISVGKTPHMAHVSGACFIVTTTGLPICRPFQHALRAAYDAAPGTRLSFSCSWHLHLILVLSPKVKKTSDFSIQYMSLQYCATPTFFICTLHVMCRPLSSSIQSCVTSHGTKRTSPHIGERSTRTRPR